MLSVPSPSTIHIYGLISKYVFAAMVVWGWGGHQNIKSLCICVIIFYHNNYLLDKEMVEDKDVD